VEVGRRDWREDVWEERIGGSRRRIKWACLLGELADARRPGNAWSDSSSGSSGGVGSKGEGQE
jgi:hypothetical protein